MKLAETPIKVNKLLDLIEHYPNKIDKKNLSAGFLHGFKVGYESPRDPTNCNNLISAHQNKNALAKKILKELGLNRIAGPFPYRPFPNLRLSPVGLFPKKTGGWRLIHHLSYPFGKC